jgi:hypothetical protein
VKALESRKSTPSLLSAAGMKFSTIVPIYPVAVMALQTLGWLISKSASLSFSSRRSAFAVPSAGCKNAQQHRRIQSCWSFPGSQIEVEVRHRTFGVYHQNRIRHRSSLLFSSIQGGEEKRNRRQKKTNDNSLHSSRKKKSHQNNIPKKIVVKDITPDKLDKLAAAFDELARKDGFDRTMSRMTDDATFEDGFVDYYDDDDADDGDDMVDVYRDRLSSSSSKQEFGDSLNQQHLEEDDADFLDFGGGTDDDDMESRIAQAKRDMVRGQVTIPDELNRFADDVKEDDLRRLGFQKEDTFYGNDEALPMDPAILVANAMTCSACGSDFQSRDEMKPGFLPKEKFDQQVQLFKIEEMQQLKKKAEDLEWSAEDEIEFLIQTQGRGALGANTGRTEAADIDIDAMAEEMGLDLAKIASKKVICKRCHGLQNFGKVDNSLRPGWTDEPTMSQEQFREMLRPISEKAAVVVALVDLFDFGGSVLRELDGIAGDNPVILAANKADLLPSQMGKQRVENWVRRELEYMGVRSIANVGGAIRLVSCKTGEGISEMMRKARELAEEMNGDVYIVGAANAGKSTLINFILSRDQERPAGKIRAGNRNQFKGALTTSPLPGTTLKFIKIDLGDGRCLYDTPGLLVPGTITQLLTPEELKIVCPKK